MLRRGLLWLSEQQQVFNFVRRNRLAKRFASRFVAGETADDGARAAESLAQRGIMATLDLLGESVHKAEASEVAAAQYVALLERMAQSPGIEVNASVKLTQMGFDIDDDLCFRNVSRILDRARDLNGFVRIDMESSAHTQRTLDFFGQRLLPVYGTGRVGVVIQSALRRSTEDVKRLILLGARVRLCKGAYLEPPEVAFPDKADVDRHYVELMERLLREGNGPALATHDEAIVQAARQFAAREGIPPERYEFQMLYGIRRDLQATFAADGYRMRIYVPFGHEWFPYFMRRLGERPANVGFVLKGLIADR